MLSTLSNTKVKLIGDPHLGKKFVEGVAPHRRGEREAEQMEHFRRELNTPGVDMNVMMGDIFDAFLVSTDTLVQTFTAYLHAATALPNTLFVLLRGNHDVSRDMERYSSFDILTEMLAQLPNVKVVDDVEIIEAFGSKEPFLFCGYSAFISTKDRIREHEEFGVIPRGTSVVAAFGHWDADSFGNDFNLVPIETLGDFTSLAFSGHVHTPYERSYDRPNGTFQLVGTGSMQPYTFAEDPHGDLYVTDTLENVERNLEGNPEFYKDKCLRIILEPGRSAPAIECRQLATKSTGAGDNQEMEVRSEEFQFASVFRDHFGELGFNEQEISTLWNEYQGVERDVQES